MHPRHALRQHRAEPRLAPLRPAEQHPCIERLLRQLHARPRAAPAQRDLPVTGGRLVASDVVEARRGRQAGDAAPRRTLRVRRRAEARRGHRRGLHDLRGGSCLWELRPRRQGDERVAPEAHRQNPRRHDRAPLDVVVEVEAEARPQIEHPDRRRTVVQRRRPDQHVPQRDRRVVRQRHVAPRVAPHDRVRPRMSDEIVVPELVPPAPHEANPRRRHRRSVEPPRTRVGLVQPERLDARPRVHEPRVGVRRPDHARDVRFGLHVSLPPRVTLRTGGPSVESHGSATLAPPDAFPRG